MYEQHVSMCKKSFCDDKQKCKKNNADSDRRFGISMRPLDSRDKSDLLIFFVSTTMVKLAPMSRADRRNRRRSRSEMATVNVELEDDALRAFGW